MDSPEYTSGLVCITALSAASARVRISFNRLIASIKLIRNGLNTAQALEMGIINKSTDDFERQLVSDIVAARISGQLTAADLFDVK